jgi:hypothetical protein
MRIENKEVVTCHISTIAGIVLLARKLGWMSYTILLQMRLGGGSWTELIPTYLFPAAIFYGES